MRDYLWSKFQQTCAIFSEERAQNQEPPPPPCPQNCGFMDAALPQRHLNIYNLTATNAKLMKLTTSMYLHKK